MPRSVNSVAAKARRKKVMKQAKGYFGRRKNVWTVAKNAVEKGLTYAYSDRKKKKRNFRALWIARINAASREYDMSYSVFMGKLNAANIKLNRKVLADLALNHPDAFKAVVNNDEFDRLNEKFLLSPTKLMDLRALVGKHYRDQLNPEDLLDIKLMQESYTFLDELTQLLDLGALYNFQKN